MKRIGLGLLSVITLLSVTSCKEETTNNNSASYPTDGLTVEKKQYVFVMETTGAWCQYCPNGAEMLKVAEEKYKGSLVAVAAHTGDELEGTPATLLNNNFPSTGVPNFYVMNDDSGQDIDGAISGALYPDTLPTFGVTHRVVQTDSSYNVYPLIEVLNNSTEEAYFIQTYLILDAVQAKAYGTTMDLNQVSSVPIVSTGSGATPSKWAQDAAMLDGEPLVKAGDLYYHEHCIFAMDERASDWGMPIASVNPFGNNYIAGDLFGTKYTPILLSVEKTSLSPWETSLSFATIVWRLRTDGTGGYDYINGYVSHLN